MLMIGSLLLFAYTCSSLLITYMLKLGEDKVKNMLRNKSYARTSVTLLDQDVLECPICCEPLKIPIYQCTNGHIACTSCWTKVKSICPSCQQSVRKQFRCRAMEKVIEAAIVPCPNANYGCKEINISYTHLSSHEKLCLFAKYSCPVRNCNYTGSSKDLYNHVCANHTFYAYLVKISNISTAPISSVLSICCLFGRR
ncbi:PREDICTED: E3 ubiquitin-protein ligase SINA-like 10 [Camelina sativa]|uniref:RING-type E3 ubiquitin transferase n=1 Tax=Camelina sativa TaxID=90675 RepID=A0ABM0U4K2_CAMSA|nr:PREDICTED: E3 ubiquitin-protein ligase SINA-like 10 [Camelina sativa]